MVAIKKIALAGQWIAGLALLLSGLVKVWEPVLFYWQLIPYTQLLNLTQSWQPVALGLLVLIPLQCALGLALLTDWRPRAIVPLAVVGLAFVIGLLAAAWKAQATIDCGCFGLLVDRGPGAAAIEYGLVTALLLLGWWDARGRSARPWAGWLVGGATLLALLIATIRFVPARERLENSDLLPGVRLTGLKPAGLELNLMKGEYLVELMSPLCGQCRDSVPKLNRLAAAPDVPRIVALTSFAQDSRPLEDFKVVLQPHFPIGTISRVDFFRLTWRRVYPRLAYVRDGVVRQVWEHHEFPTADAVRAAMGHSVD